MSSVAFHSPDHVTVRVGGVKRIWACLLCTHIMHGVWGLADFPAFRFTHRLSAFDLLAEDWVVLRQNSAGCPR